MSGITMSGMEGGLSPALQASWDRCVSEYGLSPQSRSTIHRLTGAEVRVSRSRMEEILAVTAPIVGRLRAIARNANYCFMISDRDGVVVNGYSDSDTARELRERGLRAGTVWQEAFAGTNAIGTSIALKTTITVSGDDHFFPDFRELICSSAPIVDHDGRIQGALDLTGKVPQGESEKAFVHQLIHEAAIQMQTRLFRRHHQRDFMVALSRTPNFGPAELNAFLALDNEGAIVGATRQGLELLGLTNMGGLIGKSVEGLLGVTFEALQSSIGQTQSIAAGKTERGFAVSLPPQSGKAGPASPRRHAAPVKRPAMPSGVITLENLAGHDRRMRKNVDLSRRLIDRDVAILLQGETGVGKDAFAKALHAESLRREKPFVAVNCAAIPGTLLDSELFGYAPGTFTGALKEGKTGKITASSGGTLFLDEIGDMPLELQARLLRVLAEHEVTPLGAVDPIAVDLRLICATHRNLADLVGEGRFREDLYYRINGAKLTLPALRNRDDTGDLIRAIAERVRDPGGETPFTAEAWDMLLKYSWPGNIRQLRNVLQFALCNRDQGRIRVDDLPEDLRQAARTPSRQISHPPLPPRLVSLGTLKRSTAQAERERIVGALRQSKWCVTEAACLLGVSRATVHRKIKAYGIVRSSLEIT